MKQPKTTEATATSTKPTLSESQRQGAITRALEAANHAAKIAAAAIESSHKHADLIGDAATDALAYCDEAKLAGSVADAQYASRKAIEADAATGWLWTQK